MAANAVVHLPPVIVLALGHAQLGLLPRSVAFAAHFVKAAAALLRQVRQGTRLWASFFCLYVITADANLVGLRGPYAQVGLVAYPVLVLVLVGAPAATNQSGEQRWIPAT